jgi:hypothetical protein
MLDLKFMVDKIEEKKTLEGMCTACYAENMIIFSPFYSYTQGDVP